MGKWGSALLAYIDACWPFLFLKRVHNNPPQHTHTHTHKIISDMYVSNMEKRFRPAIPQCWNLVRLLKCIIVNCYWTMTSGILGVHFKPCYNISKTVDEIKTSHNNSQIMLPISGPSNMSSSITLDGLGTDVVVSVEGYGIIVWEGEENKL